MQGKLLIYNFIILCLTISVGKTSLLYQFVKNQFSLQYKATIGADFLTKLIQRGEESIQLQLWDTAGAERYNSMGSSFYRNSEACILVFDLTNPESFKNVEAWRNEFLNTLNPPDSSTYPFVLFGNKSDLPDVKVNNDEIEAYCREHNNMPYFSTSAKEDINLEQGFNKVADMAFARHTKNEDSFVPAESKFLKVNKEEPKKNKCCG